MDFGDEAVSRIKGLIIEAVRVWARTGKHAVCQHCGAEIHPTSEAAHVFALDKRLEEMRKAADEALTTPKGMKTIE